MKSRPSLRHALLCGGLLASLGALHMPVAVQAHDVSAHDVSVERDISGTWERYPEDWAGPDPDNPIPPNGPFKLNEPYASAYDDLQERKAAANLAGTPLANSSTRCLPEGMPTIMEAIYPIQIVQTDGQVIVLAEFLTQTRRIWLNDAMPPADEISPSFNGHSVARWEGDVLVIETQGVRPDVTYYGIPHTDDLRLTERIRRVDEETLEDHVTIHDPTVFAEPYSFTLTYKKSDYRISEYICENNQIEVSDDGGSYLDLGEEDY
ncbi:hypothetical protein GRF63_06540 [Erythrobacter sp. GH3-10]|uniref:Uncharacterized protein n=2 Tax=Aurantiacibacter rhizosphaerae TaxID=2691582 RepID=A0A844XCR8_9SPHN|nr:hypothetical protein [Aurantiacibacter rhizosphaerae]